MPSYKPKEKPFFTALFENSIFHVIVILLALGFIGTRILRGSAVENLGQRIMHPYGVTRSEKKSRDTSTDVAESASESQPTTENVVAGDSNSAKDSTREKSALASAAPTPNASGDNSAGTSTAKSDPNSVSFKLTYAEISSETLAKWINDSSNLGLYQSLPEYSIGQLTDFRKRRDPIKQNLKSADLKVLPGSSASNLSGIMSDDGSTLIGIATTIELKLRDNEALHGNIMVTKNSRQGTENFPGEFELPKGAAFFILGAMKTENFINERTKLLMPPFQIFKSPEFMTHKAEFVIIIEPDYK